MRRPGKMTVMGWLVALMLGAAGLAAVQALSGSAEVRIGARPTSDGRVEVALQQRGDDGNWGALIRPDARLVPAGATVGRWLYSSPVSVSVGAAEDAMSSSMTGGDGSLHCFVHHGEAGDSFWEMADAAAGWAIDDQDIRVRIEGHAAVADVASAILGCARDGAAVIATTYTDAEALAPAVSAANRSGSALITFNSNDHSAAEIRDAQHLAIQIDERGSAVKAGEAMSAAGVTGTLLCVQHERGNVGLQTRCEGLEAGYDGEVEIVNVHGAADVSAALAEKIAADGVGGLVTLNADTGEAALAAVTSSGSKVKLGSFGSSAVLEQALERGQLSFLIYDHPEIQGYLAVSSMNLFRHILREGLAAQFGHTTVLIQPQVRTSGGSH